MPRSRRPPAPTLLLDEMISPAVAAGLRHRGVDAVPLQEAESGRLLSAPDDEILRFAMRTGRVLVTFDLATIPTLLSRMAVNDTKHAGVVLVSTKTIRPDEIGVLVDSLERLVSDERGARMHGRVIFLTRTAR